MNPPLPQCQKPDKNILRKLEANTPDEQRCENPQKKKNSSNLNLGAPYMEHTAWTPEQDGGGARSWPTSSHGHTQPTALHRTTISENSLYTHRQDFSVSRGGKEKATWGVGRSRDTGQAEPTPLVNWPTSGRDITTPEGSNPVGNAPALGTALGKPQP